MTLRLSGYAPSQVLAVRSVRVVEAYAKHGWIGVGGSPSGSLAPLPWFFFLDDAHNLVHHRVFEENVESQIYGFLYYLCYI